MKIGGIELKILIISKAVKNQLIQFCTFHELMCLKKWAFLLKNRWVSTAAYLNRGVEVWNPFFFNYIPVTVN